MSVGFHSALSHPENLKLTEQGSMDCIFLLGEADRAAFLLHTMRSFGWTYICLWLYSPLPSNCLLYLDGLYHEPSAVQPSSSSGTLARRLFSVYCQSVNSVDQGRLPGFAFKNCLPYMEMKLNGLLRLASSEVQMQFYQEAGIKTAVFMGCALGEIELGLSSEPLVDLMNEMKNWFHINFPRQTAPGELPQPPSQDPRSSLFNLPSSSFIGEPTKEALILEESLVQDTPRSVNPILAPPICTTSHHRQAMDALTQIQSTQPPTIECEDDAMRKAILAVTSSPSICGHQAAPNLSPVSPASHEPAAFRSYQRAASALVAARRDHRKHDTFRNQNSGKMQELRVRGNWPAAAQLHHMISERKRREKINESFQVLRSLLPPGSKKDKASLLSCTTEYLSSLQSQVEELGNRNHVLESQLSSATTQGGEVGRISASSTGTVTVEIAQVSASTSEARFLDLRVGLRSGEKTLMDLVKTILEFLKEHRKVSLLSIQSTTRMVEATPQHGLVLRLRVEGDEFDESSFHEAVRRAVGDPPH